MAPPFPPPATFYLGFLGFFFFEFGKRMEKNFAHSRILQKIPINDHDQL